VQEETGLQAYREVGLEDLVLPVLHLAVLLAGGLLHAVLVVGAEEHAHLQHTTGLSFVLVFKIWRVINLLPEEMNVNS